MYRILKVNRLDDTCLAIRPDIKPFKEVLEVLTKNGGVEAKAFSNNPKIKPAAWHVEAS